MPDSSMFGFNSTGGSFILTHTYIKQYNNYISETCTTKPKNQNPAKFGFYLPIISECTFQNLRLQITLENSKNKPIKAYITCWMTPNKCRNPLWVNKRCFQGFKMWKNQLV
jgi:hypothetical protein